jgi:hypothetical protein
MSYGPLTLARRHLLGDLYSRCDRSSTVPVYLNDTEGEMLGYADEGRHHVSPFRGKLQETRGRPIRIFVRVRICRKSPAGPFRFEATGQVDLDTIDRAEKLRKAATQESG